MSHEQVLFTPLCLEGFSFTSASSMHMPPRVISHVFFHGNLTPQRHRCLTPLTNIINKYPLLGIFQDCLCVGFMGLLGAIYRSCSNLKRDLSLLHLWKGFKYIHPTPALTMKGTSTILPPLPYTTIGFDTTC